METNKPTSPERESRNSGVLIRDEVKEFILGQPEVLVREVAQISEGLCLPPLRKTVSGCLKVLGNRFGGASKLELGLAVVAVQTWILLAKSESEQPKK